MSDATLLPCPFCGSESLSGPHLCEYVGDSYSPSWWIECNDCPCTMEVKGDVRNMVVRAWNTRSTPEVRDEDQEGWCGHCACQSCYDAKRKADHW